MKKALLSLGAAALFLASCAGNPEGTRSDSSDAAEVVSVEGTGELTVDPEASEVRWEGSKVTGSHYGTVDIKSGTLTFVDSNLTGGNFVLDLTTLSSTDLEGEYKEKLDGHLKAEDFFDVEKYPEAKFEITNVANEGNTLKVSGNLTIKDATKNITFDVEPVSSSAEAFEGKADFNIVRGDWGVNYAGNQDDLISKEINFKIHLVAKP